MLINSFTDMFYKVLYVCRGRRAFIDNEPAKAYVKANTGLKILETTYADEDYAIAFNKSNPTLQE